MSSHRACRVAAFLLVGAVVASGAGAQEHPHPVAAATVSTAPADGRAAFAILKSLSGAWQGQVTEPTSKLSVLTNVTLRTTSRGNALVHEIASATDTDNPLKNDHPVTMLYLDGASLLLTHYCDAGNRPRMIARVSPDGRVVDFDFIDVVGPTEYGHMQHARFTLIDDAHHVEDWTYEVPGGRTVVGHFELTRVSRVAAVTPK